jgi:hypothetical protein
MLGVVRAIPSQDMAEKLGLEDLPRVVFRLHFEELRDIRFREVVSHVALWVAERALAVPPPVRAGLVFAQAQLLDRLHDG